VRLGLRGVETTDQLRQALGVPADRGVLLLEVVGGGPAESAGLRAGDVVTHVAGDAVGDPGDILEALDGHAPGDEVPVEYVRDHNPASVTVKLDEARGHAWKQFPLPGFELPKDLEDEFQQFRDRIERQLEELHERLRRLEKGLSTPS
jgi:predicted metalloprotease with PDZ domain